MALAMYVNGVGRAIQQDAIGPKPEGSNDERIARCPSGMHYDSAAQKCVPDQMAIPSRHRPKTMKAMVPPRPAEITKPPPTPACGPKPPDVYGYSWTCHRGSWVAVPTSAPTANGNGVTTVVPQNGAETPIPQVPAEAYTPAQYAAAKPPIGKYVAGAGILAALGFGAFLIARRRRE